MNFFLVTTLFLSWCIIYTFENFKKLEKESEYWTKSYLFLNNSLNNFIHWGKNSDTIQTTKSLVETLKTSFIFFFASMFISVSIDFLNFLFLPLIYVIVFHLYVIYSFNWICNSDERQSDYDLIKIITIFLALITIFTINSNGNEAIYFIVLIFFTFVYFNVKLFMWIFYGWMPTLILLFIFSLKKLSYATDYILNMKKILYTSIFF